MENKKSFSYLDLSRNNEGFNLEDVKISHNLQFSIQESIELIHL